MSSDDLNIKKIKGKLMYPKLFQPDTRFEHKWTLDLLLDAEGLKEAQEEGLRVKKNDNWGDLFEGYDGSFIRVERPIKSFSGEEREPPRVIVFNKGMTGPIDVPSSTGIGNGTDAYARFLIKTRDNQGKEMSPAQAQKKYDGYGMFLTGVQIINLVPYERNSDPDVDFVEADGTFDPTENSSGEFDWEKGDEPFDDSKDVTMAG